MASKAATSPPGAPARPDRMQEPPVAADEAWLGSLPEHGFFTNQRDLQRDVGRLDARDGLGQATKTDTGGTTETHRFWCGIPTVPRRRTGVRPSFGSPGAPSVGRDTLGSTLRERGRPDSCQASRRHERPHVADAARDGQHARGDLLQRRPVRLASVDPPQLHAPQPHAAPPRQSSPHRHAAAADFDRF